MQGFVESSAIRNGISRLDKDVADARGRVAEVQQQLDELQGRLAELEAMRSTAMHFIEQYVAANDKGAGTYEAARAEAAIAIGLRAAHAEDAAAESSSFVDEVLGVFRQLPEADLDVDQVWKILQEKGSQQDKERVRNSINYARRLGKIQGGYRRGKYILTPIDTSAPVAPGADVNEESDSEGSS